MSMNLSSLRRSVVEASSDPSRHLVRSKYLDCVCWEYKSPLGNGTARLNSREARRCPSSSASSIVDCASSFHSPLELRWSKEIHQPLQPARSWQAQRNRHLNCLVQRGTYLIPL